jgi:hypothetical protein
MHPGGLEEASDLPTVEAMTAFMEAVLAVTLDPWGIAGHPDQPHVTITFGPAKQGHISYLIMDDRRTVYLTQVQWAGD